MRLVLQTANVVSDAKNCLYPNRVEAGNAAELQEAIKKDHVCGEYKSSGVMSRGKLEKIQRKNGEKGVVAGKKGNTNQSPTRRLSKNFQAGPAYPERRA